MTNKLPAAASQSQAEALLRAAAVRVTGARLKVLTALLDARRALSHQDLQDRFAEMDRVTLYRALDCLSDAALAHKIAGDDRLFRYSAGAAEQGERDAAAATRGVPAQHAHGHFKCTRCAKVFCLDASGEAGLLAGLLADSSVVSTPQQASAARRQLQDALQQTLGPGFQSHDIELTIKGWCADCAALATKSFHSAG